MGTLSRTTRRNLVRRGHPQASLSLQCRLLGLCRSTLYYRPQAPDADELALLRRLMRKLGLKAIYCKPRCSQPQPGHRVYPYLLRNLSIERPHPVSGMFDADQGSQFTAQAFTGCLEGAGARIPTAGRGRWTDTVFIERLWRSLKYEAAYLQELADGFAARELIGEWIGFHNAVRPRSSLGGRTPREALQEGGGTRGRRCG